MLMIMMILIRRRTGILTKKVEESGRYWRNCCFFAEKKMTVRKCSWNLILENRQLMRTAMKRAAKTAKATLTALVRMIEVERKIKHNSDAVH